jgi:hypothetical protein
MPCCGEPFSISDAAGGLASIKRAVRVDDRSLFNGKPPVGSSRSSFAASALGCMTLPQNPRQGSRRTPASSSGGPSSPSDNWKRQAGQPLYRKPACRRSFPRLRRHRASCDGASPPPPSPPPVARPAPPPPPGSKRACFQPSTPARRMTSACRRSNMEVSEIKARNGLDHEVAASALRSCCRTHSAGWSSSAQAIECKLTDEP